MKELKLTLDGLAVHLVQQGRCEYCPPQAICRGCAQAVVRELLAKVHVEAEKTGGQVSVVVHEF